MKKLKNKKIKHHDEFANESIGESLKGILSGIGHQAADTAKDMASLEKVLGLARTQEKHAGELSEGQELDLKELHGKKQEQVHIEAGIDYHRDMKHLGERAVNQENREMEAQLRELMAEIKKLADSSKELQAQFKEVAVEQHAVKPGKYHKSFFTWLLSVIRIARMKVEDSNAWLSSMHSKKKSREYGAMAKKHGTGFTLSNERNVATQVG